MDDFQKVKCDDCNGLGQLKKLHQLKIYEFSKPSYKSQFMIIRCDYCDGLGFKLIKIEQAKIVSKSFKTIEDYPEAPINTKPSVQLSPWFMEGFTEAQVSMEQLKMENIKKEYYLEMQKEMSEAFDKMIQGESKKVMNFPMGMGKTKGI